MIKYNLMYSILSFFQNDYTFTWKFIVFSTLIFFDKKVVLLWWLFFFLSKKKYTQFNFSSQNLSFRTIFFQMRWKSNQDMKPNYFSIDF